MSCYSSTHKKAFIENYQKAQKINSRFLFAEILSEWLCQNMKWPDVECDFLRCANIIISVIHKDDAFRHACDLVLYLIEFFAHPTLKSSAVKAKSMFKKLIQNDLSSSSSTPLI